MRFIYLYKNFDDVIDIYWYFNILTIVSSIFESYKIRKDLVIYLWVMIFIYPIKNDFTKYFKDNI